MSKQIDRNIIKIPNLTPRIRARDEQVGPLIYSQIVNAIEETPKEHIERRVSVRVYKGKGFYEVNWSYQGLKGIGVYLSKILDKEKAIEEAKDLEEGLEKEEVHIKERRLVFLRGQSIIDT